MSEENQFAALKLPAIINFYEFTGIANFDNSNEKKKLLEYTCNWERKEKTEKRIKFAWVFSFFGLFILSFVLYYIVSILILILCLILFLASFVFLLIKTIPMYRKNIKNGPQKEPPTEEQEYNNYLSNVLREIQTHYLNDFRAFGFDNWGFLFYSKLGCACIDLKSGQMVLYAKENIKDVLLEHIHLGSTTTGASITSGTINRGIIFDFRYTQHSTTNIGTSSIQHYEWRLDILTDFIEFPKLSFRFAENSNGEDEAKII